MKTEKEQALKYINEVCDLRMLFLEIKDAKALKSACLRYLGDKHEVFNALNEHSDFEVFIKPVYGRENKYALELLYLEAGDGDKMPIYICHDVEVMDDEGGSRLEMRFEQTVHYNYSLVLQQLDLHLFDSVEQAQWAAVNFMDMFKKANK